MDISAKMPSKCTISAVSAWLYLPFVLIV